MGGEADLRTLVQMSKLDYRIFWDSVRSLLINGDIELLGDIIKLKMEAA